LGDSGDSVVRAYEQLAAFTPFQRRDWIDGWQRHLGDPRGRKPVTVIGHRAGTPVLILPLHVYSQGGTRRIGWLADDLNDYCGPIAEPRVLQALSQIDVRRLLEQTAGAIGGADIVLLEKQPKFYGAMENPFAGFAAVGYHVKAHATHLGKGWDEYYSAKRSAKTRRRLKEKFKALSKLGRVETRFSNDPAEAADLVGQCLDMKARQLKRRGHWNPFSVDGAKAHLTSYFGIRCNEGTWVAGMFLDGLPIAISFGFRDSREWLLYQIAMDEGPQAAYSPGTHLLMTILKHCCERGVEVFDLALGDEAYKNDWCEETTTLTIGILPLSPRGTLASFGLRLAAGVRNFIASRPAMLAQARHARNWLKTRSLSRIFADRSSLPRRESRAP
jgi:CelD/BcsL family acetyltransferase involved in cellulose biosynthesis